MAFQRASFRSHPKLKARRGGTRKDKGLVQIKDDLSKLVQANLDDVAPALSRAINKHLVPVMERAEARWPVDTGRSREALNLRYDVAPDGIEIILENTAPYSAEIYWKGGDEKRDRVADELIFEAGRKAAEAVADDLLEDLKRGR